MLDADPNTQSFVLLQVRNNSMNINENIAQSVRKMQPLKAATFLKANMVDISCNRCSMVILALHTHI